MIKIQITSPEIREFKGESKSTGKPYHIRVQTGYAFTCDASGVLVEFPDKFEFTLRDGDQPYPRGVYQLAPSSLFVDRDGRLSLSPRLVPVSAPAK